ncbi:hypothetical protein BCR34DRAFT_134591 [Clohesyomyces aquaticus]|uniref:Uncharacterized protein n=1 Tax=Clohesyomyces aquaticus TaxID=1231657 RepID=A0A1Y2AAM2_9PLEO|nr:hypothetical protein BCR34DRAFT_134591 [Clohesyomyces aquaticus]
MVCRFALGVPIGCRIMVGYRVAMLQSGARTREPLRTRYQRENTAKPHSSDGGWQGRGPED